MAKKTKAKGSTKKDIEDIKEVVTDEVEAVTEAVETAAEAEDAIVDAEIVEDFPPDPEEPLEDAPAVELDEPEAEVTDEASIEAEAIDEILDEAIEETSEDVGVVAEDIAEPAPAAEQVVVRKGGFFPMLMGGVAAAAIGFGLAQYVLPDGWPLGAGSQEPSEFETETLSALESQNAAIEALQFGAGSVATKDDLAALTAQLDAGLAAQADVSPEITALTERLGAIEERLTVLEKAPVSGGVSDAAITAYERELAALQESVSTQRAEIEAIAAEAANKEAEAQEMAQATLARAALTRVTSAVDSGAPFASALADYVNAGGSDVPEVLNAVSESGVATLVSLQEEFPEAARGALAVSRSEASDGAGGLGTFLARQLGARSVTPREGSDADAVLSRAEAAVRDGRLGDALAEIETLDEAALAVIAPWVEAATARRDAQAAIETLASRLGEN